MTSFDYDEIGYWSEVKLDIVKKYAAAYTTIMRRVPAIRKYVYIDAFAGAGRSISRRTRGFIPAASSALARLPRRGRWCG